MTNVFLLVSDPSSLRPLAVALPGERLRVSVGVLGPIPGACLQELHSAGLVVHPVPIRHPFDLNGVRRLRRTVREANPAVIHAWGPSAVRAARVLITSKEERNTPRLVVSGAAELGGGPWGWLTARVLRRADRVVASSRAEGERYRELGVRSDRLTLIANAAPSVPLTVDRESVLRELGVPAGSPFLVASGRSDAGIGPKDAIVAFDMTRYDARDLHLVVFDTGTEARSLEQFGRALAFDDFRVRFAPPAANRAAAVSQTTAVLVTRRRGGGEEALEAMAAGKPVLGWNTPELAEIVDDGVTGLLVPVGDRAALATQLRALLDNPEFANKLGEAGRSRVAEHFGLPRMVELVTRLYGEIAG